MDQSDNDTHRAAFFAMLDTHVTSIKVGMRPDAKVTIIVRAPEALPHEAMISTNDDLATVNAAVAHFSRDPIVPPEAERRYQLGVQNGRDAGITIGRHQAQTVIATAIAVALSEHGVDAVMKGGDPLAFEPWPEMDALLVALDAARPGWRDQAPDGG